MKRSFKFRLRVSRHQCLCLGVLLCLFCCGQFSSAQEKTGPDKPAAPDFRKDIQPLLATHCLKCHGPDKQKGGLRLDVKSSALKGGESGERAIVPGHPEQSHLLELVASKDETQRMPPEGEPLNAAQIDLLKNWIESGAVWDESASAPANSPRKELVITEEDRNHWSFRPLQNVTPPDVNDQAWVKTPVDRFIRKAQEAKDLSPAPPAVARTLIRRMYFDLIGLPPELKIENGKLTEKRLGIEIDEDAFLRDPSSVVNALLDSPQYGERWARHWLDVARFADSNGQEGDADRPNAYRFRDFVIHALNDDLPFDTFVRWQLAGDEIAPDDPLAIAATGFIVAGNSTMLNVPMEEEKMRNRANELDDMVSTTAQALLGLTLACARCHDHKYDPLPTRDYYRLMRVFNGGDRKDVPLVSPAEVQSHNQTMQTWQKKYDDSVKQRDGWVKEARKPFVERVRKKKIERLPIEAEQKAVLRDKPDSREAKDLANRFKKELKIDDQEYFSLLSEEQKKHWANLNLGIKTLESKKPAALPVAFAFADFGPEPKETWFFERGNFLARNEKMDLGFLSVLTNGKTPDDYWREAREHKLRDDSTQQRRAMAEWITDLDHGAGTLLARVIVNRVWQHHFGEGLVRTVSDFGTRGDLPTHPELLEWLTSEFVRSGWSLKHLHRLIVNSAAYRQGEAANDTYSAIDPDNHLLWHRTLQRLESEVLRDSMLAVAGTLNPEMNGPSFKPPIAGEAMQARNVKDPYPRDLKDTPETRRRSVYMFHKRVVQYPLMQAFDAPDAQVSCGRRVNTTVAPQALALLNDPFVRLRSAEFATRLQAEAGDDINSQIRLAFQLALARQPAEEELSDTAAFITDQIKVRSKRPTNFAPEKPQVSALTDFCQMLFSLNEFIYVD